MIRRKASLCAPNKHDDLTPLYPDNDLMEKNHKGTLVTVCGICTGFILDHWCYKCGRVFNRNETNTYFEEKKYGRYKYRVEVHNECKLYDRNESNICFVCHEPVELRDDKLYCGSSGYASWHYACTTRLTVYPK